MIAKRKKKINANQAQRQSGKNNTDQWEKWESSKDEEDIAIKCDQTLFVVWNSLKVCLTVKKSSRLKLWMNKLPVNFGCVKTRDFPLPPSNFCPTSSQIE